MIAAISDWVKAIVAVGVLVAFVEMMAPKGAMRKSVDMVLALIIVSAIAGPIIELGATLLPMAGAGYSDAAGGGGAPSASQGRAVADGVALCISAGLAAAYPGVSARWSVTVTPAQRRGEAMSATVDTGGWARDEALATEVRMAAAASAGVSIDRITVR